MSCVLMCFSNEKCTAIESVFIADTYQYAFAMYACVALLNRKARSVASLVTFGKEFGFQVY